MTGTQPADGVRPLLKLPFLSDPELWTYRESKLEYRFFVEEPGRPIIWSDDLRTPPHSRPAAADRDGARRGRLNLRVPRRLFSARMGVGGLVGPPAGPSGRSSDDAAPLT